MSEEIIKKEETSEEITKPLESQEWYIEFIEQCHAIIVETRFNSTTELLRGKWELGKRIMEEELNFERAGYGKQLIKIIAQDLEMSRSHVYKCIHFFKKFPFEKFEEVLEGLPMGKNMSWYKICQELLPKSRDEKDKEQRTLDKQTQCLHQRVKCLDCKKVIELEKGLKLFLENESKNNN